MGMVVDTRGALADFFSEALDFVTDAGRVAKEAGEGYDVITGGGDSIKNSSGYGPDTGTQAFDPRDLGIDYDVNVGASSSETLPTWAWVLGGLVAAVGIYYVVK